MIIMQAKSAIGTSMHPLETKLSYGLLISNWKAQVAAATIICKFMMEGVRVQAHWDLSIADLLAPVTKFLLPVDYTLNGDQMTQTIIPDSKLALIRNVSIKTYNYQNSTKAF